MNRVCHPVVGLVLRARAHRLLSGRVALPEFEGRRTGHRIQVPVIHHPEGPGDLRIHVAAPEVKRWWRSLRTPRPLRVQLLGKPLAATAVAIEYESDVSVRIDLVEGNPAVESGA